MLHETHQEQALAVNERIQTRVENAYIEGFAVTISLGIFVLRNDEAAIEGMLHRADKALYRAKQNGRNRSECENV
jgi:diguanylate cyclase (GGDEF)-like protein